MRQEKTWNVLGLIFGVIVMIMGGRFLADPPESYSTYTAEQAEFGGDFYTLECEATCTAARNAAATANNVRELGDKLALYSGMFFLVIGGQMVLNYGKKVFVLPEPRVSQKEREADLLKAEEGIKPGNGEM